MSVLIEEEYEGLKSASCSERNVQEGVKKSICWMATSLVFVVWFGFVVLCCLGRCGLFLEGLKECFSVFECLKAFCRELLV